MVAAVVFGAPIFPLVWAVWRWLETRCTRYERGAARAAARPTTPVGAQLSIGPSCLRRRARQRERGQQAPPLRYARHGLDVTLAQVETLTEAIARLEAAGFRDSFRAEAGRLHALVAQRFFAPDALVVEEVVRFEGESDPDAQAILFALRSPSGDVRGTFTTSFGPPGDPASAEVVLRLARAG